MRPVLILLAVSFWPLWLYIVTGKSIFATTALVNIPPLRFTAVKIMSEGSLPLWNPYIFTGMPCLGDALSGPFDLLNILFFVFNPLIACITLTAAQLFLGGLFMYLYLKKSLRLEKLSALLGGLLYILNPAYQYTIGCGLPEFAPAGTILWLPLIMLLIDKSFRAGVRFMPYPLLAGIAMSLAFFGGHGNLAFFMGCFVLLYVLFSPLAARKKFFILSIFGVVAVLLCSIQLFVTFHTMDISNRTMVWPRTRYDSTGLSLPSFLFSIFEFPATAVLSAFKLPHISSFMGIEHYASWYAGIFNLLLLSFVYFKKGDTYTIRFNKLFIPLLLIFHVCLFYLPIRGLITAVLPSLNGMRVGHSMFLFYFSAIILIALVFNNLLHGNYKEHRLQRFVSLLGKIIYPVCILSFPVMFFAGVYCYIKGRLSFSYNLERYLYIVPMVYFALLFASFFTLNKAMACKARPGKRLLYALFLLIISNVALETIDGYGRYSYKVFKAHFKDSAETRFLKNMEPEARIEVLYWGWDRFDLEFSRDQYFGFNLPLFYRAHILGGSHQLNPGRARIFMDMVNGRHPFDQSHYCKNGGIIKAPDRAYLEGKDINFSLVSLSGVKYLFSPAERQEKFLKLKLKGDSYLIYENLNVYPRAFIVYEYEVSDEEDIRDKLYYGSFNPLKKALLEEPIDFHIQPFKDNVEKPSASLILYKPNEVVIEAISAQDGLLIFTDAYDKDWKAYVDGKETGIYQADYLFRAVPVPAGKHHVRFEYMPKPFVYGAILSITTLVLSLGYIIRYAAHLP